ncbi:MAG: protein phosphatase 2C domain-containing protein [Pseudomonadota bacterium]
MSMERTASVHFCPRTHIGRVRKLNEDSILARPEIGVWVVSDGMGGHDAGDFASQTVVETIAGLPQQLEPAELMNGVRNAIQDAHSNILVESARRGGVTIGATVVSLILANEHFVCLWAGDSRLYLLRGGVLTMVSTDHSIVAALVENGQLTWDEAERHPQSNAITRAVGVGEADIEIDKVRGRVQPGDRFLLCSDGLTKYASAAVLERLLAAGPVETAADRLLEYALSGGGADNISLIVIEVPGTLPDDTAVLDTARP